MKLKVLYIEDDIEAFETFKAMADSYLKDQIKGVHALNGKEAESKFENGQFDVLVFDLILPLLEGGIPKENGGLQVYKKLSKTDYFKSTNPAIFAVSGVDDAVKAYKDYSVASSVFSDHNTFKKSVDGYKSLIKELDNLLKYPSIKTKTRLENEHKHIMQLYFDNGSKNTAIQFLKLAIDKEESNVVLLDWSRDWNRCIEATMQMFSVNIYKPDLKQFYFKSKKRKIYQFDGNTSEFTDILMVTAYFDWLLDNEHISILEHVAISSAWKISNEIKHLNQTNQGHIVERLDSDVVANNLFSALLMLFSNIPDSNNS